MKIKSTHINNDFPTREIYYQFSVNYTKCKKKEMIETIYQSVYMLKSGFNSNRDCRLSPLHIVCTIKIREKLNHKYKNVLNQCL